MTGAGEGRAAARVNLRMWSDQTPFHDAGKTIALRPERIDKKGEVVLNPRGQPLRNLDPRHDVSFEDARLGDGSELAPCVDAILAALRSSAYADGTRSKAIDATLWIAVFDETFAYEGAIGEAAIAEARKLGVRLFIEDYPRQAPDGSIWTHWLT